MSRKNKTVAPPPMKEKPVKLHSPSVNVEYPRENEIIDHPAYTFQVGTIPEAVKVHLCINQGEWLPCREALGLWWYDWSGYEAGEHEAVARIRLQDGSILVSEPRLFFVRLP